MRMPKEKVKWIEYLLEKHGEDYEVSCRQFPKLCNLVLKDILKLYNFVKLLGHGNGQK